MKSRHISIGRNSLLFVVIAVLSSSIGAYIAWKRLAVDDPEASAVATFFGLSMPDATTAPFALQALRGKVVIVNFWATWCPPCVEEMPELSALAKELKPKGIEIVGIGIDSLANIGQFSEKHQIAYPLLVAGLGGTELARQFGNTAGALPFTVLIDRQGRIHRRVLGKVKIDEIRADALALVP